MVIEVPIISKSQWNPVVIESHKNAFAAQDLIDTASDLKMIDDHEDRFLNLKKCFKKSKFLVDYETWNCPILAVDEVYNTHNQVIDHVVIKGETNRMDAPIMI